MVKDALARGARSAQFAAGDNKGEIELKNISMEPREEVQPVEIDRTRSYKKLTPKRDQILVQRKEPENISAGGIVIPDVTKENSRPAEGIVVNIGPKVEDIKVGDHVLFGLYSGTEYPFGEEKLLFMTESEIIATVEE